MEEKTNLFVGYDAKRIVANATGLGNYGRNLINALTLNAPTLRMQLYIPDAGRDDLRRQVIDSPRLTYELSGYNSKLRKDLWRSHGIVRNLQHDGIDLFHGLTGELPRGLRRAGIPAVVTIHDLIFLRHPEYYHPVDVMLYRKKFHRTLKEATRVIAISECTKRDILHYGHYPEDRIDVIYQNCSTAYRHLPTQEKMQEVKQRYHLPVRYILSVGTVEARKNVGLAVRALPSLSDDIFLVIVGRQTSYAKAVKQEALRLGIATRIIWLQGVPNSDLPAIYRQAEAFVYASRYEGFGIPVIEAIQCGLPVVAATGSCLEEAGGPDSHYVDPDDPRAMAAALTTCLRGHDDAVRQERILRSQDYVRRFEGTDIAQQMMAEYQRVYLSTRRGLSTYPTGPI